MNTSNKLLFNIISIFPEMFSALTYGILGRAQQRQLLTLNFYNPRDYSKAPHRSVDDRPYGGGPGMVMSFPPIAAAIEAAKQNSGTESQVIYLSPQGKPLQQADLNQLITQSTHILLCGRYEGIDERLLTEYVDQEYSVGDYVVSGGELPAMLLIDAMTRLLPGALGHEDSASQDSFANGLLDHPHYTRPENIVKRQAPKVLLSGHHQEIKRWRLQQALGKTWQKRPDLLKRRTLTQQEQELLKEYIDELNKPHSDGE